jgi:thioredoxin 1
MRIASHDLAGEVYPWRMPPLKAGLKIILNNIQKVSSMRKIIKVILPAAAALAVMIAVPHLRHEGGCSCQAPVVMFGSLFGCSDSKQPESVNTAMKDESAPVTGNPADRKTGKVEHKVTFVEIGSVNCIPCKMMQPIMRDVENQYRGQVRVVFHDVWTPEGRPYGMKYGIRVIPTQVFLDKDGNEYFRHEGFFPKEELIPVLKLKGVQ